MSIASQIGRIAGNVSDAFTAVRSKGGTVSQTNSDQLAAAIGTIPTDTPLPTLTDPAAAGDILSGKEAIDGNGDKLTGSLVIANTLSLAEDPTVTNGVLSVEVESSKEPGTKTFTVSVPDAVPENIVSSKTILGVAGTAKKITVIRSSDPYVPSQNASVFTVPGITAMPRAFVLKARNFALLPPHVSENVHPIYAVNFCNMQDTYIAAIACCANAITTATDEAAYERYAGVATIVNQNLRIVFAGAVDLAAKVIENVEYDWEAYYWED